MLTLGCTAIRSYGGIITQLFFLKAVLEVASMTSSSLPFPLFLKNTLDKSTPSFDLISEPNSDENEFKKSIWVTISSEISGLIVPFQ